MAMEYLISLRIADLFKAYFKILVRNLQFCALEAHELISTEQGLYFLRCFDYGLTGQDQSV